MCYVGGGECEIGCNVDATRRQRRGGAAHEGEGREDDWLPFADFLLST